MTATLPFPYTNRKQNDIDWEQPKNARTSFSLRLANALFANEWLSDMVFYVPMDDYKIPAHSLIVATASPVLQRCCFGSGSIKGDKIVTVPDDCPTHVLLIVLRYLYTGGIAEGIDASNVGQVLKLADIYDLCELQKQCEAIIESVISDATVCTIFNHMHRISNEAIAAKCMIYMKVNTGAILNNGSALAMEDEALQKLLDSTNSLAISSEMDLVKPMIKWADDQNCSASVFNAAKIREILKNRIKMINFGAMNMDEFLDCVHMFGDGFFSHKEVSLTTQQIHNRIKYKGSCEPKVYPFSSQNRIAAEARALLS